MALDDYTVIALLFSSAFFAALSVGLLFRYRQVSQRINQSSDLGRDLWQVLEQRLKKQDERILDVMTRFDVIQARVMSTPAPPAPTPIPLPYPPPPQKKVVEPVQLETEVTEPVAKPVPPQQVQREKSQVSLDKTELSALKLLASKAMSTIEIKQALDLSREHTARMMKGLFELGLVTRDDSAKPFVYQLSDHGRGYLSG